MAQDMGLLQAALIGYEAQARQLDQAIQDLRQRLGKRSGRTAVIASTNGGRRKHIISAEGRARIAEAQKRRWAKAKKDR